MADVQRSRGIRGDELDLHRLRLVLRSSTPIRARLERVLDGSHLEPRLEPEVDEPGPGDLVAGECLAEIRIGGDRGRGQRFGELARVALETLGELQRDRAGEVAVLRLPRLFEGDGEIGV